MAFHWDFDSVVIGGGPGGLVSALYLKRFQRSVLVVNCGKPRAGWIPKTNNLIGYYDGISGPDLLRRLHLQLDKHKIERAAGMAYVQRKKDGFCVTVGNNEISARKVIFATGMQDVQPQLKNLVKLRRLGLLRYCPVCDAYGYRGKVLAVLVNDTNGLERALWIRDYADKLKIIAPAGLEIPNAWKHRLREARAEVLQGNLLDIEPAKKVKGVWITLEGFAPTYARVAYIEMGAVVPDFAFQHFRNLRKSADGYLITTTEQRLSVPGLFAVGDCVNLLGQISVAAGQAAVAATAIHNDLREE